MTNAFASPLTSEAFRLIATPRILKEPAPESFDPKTIPANGDHRLADMIAPDDGHLHKPASVLIPIIKHSGEATMLLTHRASHLKDHAGQIAFPGGKIAPDDSSPLAAALREAEEEIGLDRRFVEPIGFLDPYLSSTGFRIVPVVAFVEPEHTLTIDPSEVESVFEVPLRFLMNPIHHETHHREWRGKDRAYYAMPYQGHYIWGVTAGIIRNLYERVYGP